MAKKTRLAIIGLGKMGNIHLKAVNEIMNGRYEPYYKGDVGKYLDNVILDSIVDPSMTKSKSKGIHQFRDHKELLKKRKIDAAIIAAPTLLHFDIAMDFINKGIHLLIEKPVSCTASEIRKIKKKAAEKDVFILPGHVERYNPVTLDIIEYLQYKVYGKAQHYEFTRTSRKPARIPDSIIIDKLVHDLDLLIFFFGKPKISNVKFQHDKRGQVVECDLYLEHKNGITGRILSSWKIEKKQRSIKIDAERGRIKADFWKKNLSIQRYKEFSKSVTGYANNQVKDQFADFISGVYKQPIKPLVTINDALNCGIIVDEINKLSIIGR
ncbi:MAG: Gfo/Idh/MocA family protein [Planctomycetota bacterium]